MHLHVSDEFRGRLDVVPGCCHVATEFVCVWLFPLLPRRSLLFFRTAMPDGWSMLPVRLSWRSVGVTYLRAALWGMIVASVCFLLNASGEEWRQLAPSALGVAGAATFLLLLLGRLTLASHGRRVQLAETAGLPPDVASLLRDVWFSPEWDVSEKRVIIGSKGRLSVAPTRPVEVWAMPPSPTGLASPVRRACALFLDSLVLLILFFCSIFALFGLTALIPATERFIFTWMGELVLASLIVIVTGYNVAFTASPLRATPGKRLLGLSVTNARGETLSLWKAIAREAIKYPCLVLEIWMDGFQVRGLKVHDPQSGRALHDRVSRTKVVRQAPRRTNDCPFD